MLSAHTAEPLESLQTRLQKKCGEQQPSKNYERSVTSFLPSISQMMKILNDVGCDVDFTRIILMDRRVQFRSTWQRQVPEPGYEFKPGLVEHEKQLHFHLYAGATEKNPLSEAEGVVENVYAGGDGPAGARQTPEHFLNEVNGFRVLSSAPAAVCGESTLQVYIHKDVYDAIERLALGGHFDSMSFIRTYIREEKSASPTPSWTRPEIAFVLLDSTRAEAGEENLQENKTVLNTIALKKGSAKRRSSKRNRLHLPAHLAGRSTGPQLHDPRGHFAEGACARSPLRIRGGQTRHARYSVAKTRRNQIPIMHRCLSHARDGGLRTNSCLLRSDKLTVSPSDTLGEAFDISIEAQRAADDSMHSVKLHKTW